MAIEVTVFYHSNPAKPNKIASFPIFCLSARELCVSYASLCDAIIKLTAIRREKGDTRLLAELESLCRMAPPSPVELEEIDALLADHTAFTTAKIIPNLELLHGTHASLEIASMEGAAHLETITEQIDASRALVSASARALKDSEKRYQEYQEQRLEALARFDHDAQESVRFRKLAVVANEKIYFIQQLEKFWLGIKDIDRRKLGPNVVQALTTGRGVLGPGLLTPELQEWYVRTTLCHAFTIRYARRDMTTHISRLFRGRDPEIARIDECFLLLQDELHTESERADYYRQVHMTRALEKSPTAWKRPHGPLTRADDYALSPRALETVARRRQDDNEMLRICSARLSGLKDEWVQAHVTQMRREEAVAFLPQKQSVFEQFCQILCDLDPSIDLRSISADHFPRSLCPAFPNASWNGLYPIKIKIFVRRVTVQILDLRLWFARCTKIFLELYEAQGRIKFLRTKVGLAPGSEYYKSMIPLLEAFDQALDAVAYQAPGFDNCRHWRLPEPHDREADRIIYGAITPVRRLICHPAG